MLRFELSERDQPALPPIDLADDVVVIGSAAAARVRLPAEVAQPEHVRLAGQSWTLLAEAMVGGVARGAGDSGPIGHGIAIELGRYRVAVSVAPAGAEPTPPQRTESLALELVRSLLGDGAAPSLEIERGTGAGGRRMLAPPEASLVIGRGDEAGWVILDEDLSRTHAVVRRGWDGVTVVDLGSKNGTRVDGARVRGEPVELRDGAVLALGRVVMRFRDPATRHVGGEAARPVPVAGPAAGRSWAAIAYAALALLALAALVWVVAG